MAETWSAYSHAEQVKRIVFAARGSDTVTDVPPYEHEHVPEDDPSYRGHRITDLWLLTAVDVIDDQEAIILVDPQAAARYHLTAGMPAFASDTVRADSLRAYQAELRTIGFETELKHLTITTKGAT